MVTWLAQSPPEPGSLTAQDDAGSCPLGRWDPTFPPMSSFPSNARSFGVRQLPARQNSPVQAGGVLGAAPLWLHGSPEGLVPPARRLPAACSGRLVTFHPEEWERWGLDPWHNLRTQ